MCQPQSMDAIPFASLAAADLTLEAEYCGGTAGSVADDPIAVLLPVGNQGGFRYNGSPAGGTVRLVVLYSSGVNPDWPDQLDPQNGTYTYYGDNRKPGQPLHKTQRLGNEILRATFADADRGLVGRQRVPPSYCSNGLGIPVAASCFEVCWFPGLHWSGSKNSWSPFGAAVAGTASRTIDPCSPSSTQPRSTGHGCRRCCRDHGRRMCPRRGAHG